MVIVNTHQAKTKLSSLLSKVETSREEVVICRNDKPVAKLVPYEEQATDPFQQHPQLRGVVFLDDPCAPIDESFWPEE